MPTPQHHEGAYAYYFYRLIQRAERVDLVYCSRSDDKHRRAQSLHLPARIRVASKPVYRPIRLGVNLSARQPLSVDKTGQGGRCAARLLGRRTKRLSPTSFYHYVECPLKFYFRSVAGLSPQQEIAEEVDLPMFGTILHRTMELLYAPLLGDPAAGPKIRSPCRICGGEGRRPAGDQRRVPARRRGGEEEYGGNLILVRDVVAKYVNSCILPYDASQTGFVMRGAGSAGKLSVRFEEGTGSIRLFSQESPTGSTCSPTACCAWSITKRANGISGSKKISNRCFSAISANGARPCCKRCFIR